MKRFFDKELENFRSHLVLMGETAVGLVRQATQSLLDGDLSLADQVAAADDELDKLEIKIDEEAVRYMNLRSPVATELRLIIVGMKASHDLERVGDETTNIVRRVGRLTAEPRLKTDTDLDPYSELARMTSIAVEMLRDALECFLQVDADKALAVCKRDVEVDAINKRLYRDMTRLMVERPATVTTALELMFVSKSLERIADHATNIAEEMIYLAKGQDVRHSDETKNPNLA